MKFKRSIALIISVVMIFASLTSLVSAASVSDIDEHWAEPYIQSLLDKEIVSGYPDGTYRPDNSVTRAEFCKIVIGALVQMGVVEDYVEPTGVFTDVPVDEWYAKFIETAYTNELVGGVGNDKFDPEANITRQEMAKIISLVYIKVNGGTFEELLAQYKAEDYNLGDIDTAADWAKDFIKVALVEKVMQGSDGGFKPNDQVTRAETATVTYRIMEAVPTPVVTTPPPGPIRIHGEKLTIQTASLVNYPDYEQPNANSPITLLFDGIASDKASTFTCKFDMPEYLFDLGEVKDIQSFAIKGYSTGYQFVYFKLQLSADNESWVELGSEATLKIGQPIIDDPSIYIADNFDADGHLISGTAPTKFDVTTEDPNFIIGNYQTRTLLNPLDGSERDVDTFASPMFDHTLTGVDWKLYGYVDDNKDYLFHYFLDDVQQARYIRVIGFGNSMTQWYMFSSFTEVQAFGPGTSEDKPV